MRGVRCGKCVTAIVARVDDTDGLYLKISQGKYLVGVNYRDKGCEKEVKEPIRRSYMKLL